MSTLTDTTTLGATAPKGRSAELPQWATGDPFFDTMAGMDPKEYNKLYKEGEAADSEKADLSIEDQMATLSTEAKEGKASQLDEDPNIGLAYWNRRRDEWTGGQWRAVESNNKENPLLKSFEMSSRHLAIYKSLIDDKRPLSTPTPLPLVVSVLISGWKSEGLWQEAATSQPPPPTLRTPTPQPPTPQGLVAQTPGFSSTKPKSKKKKAKK
ncbi:hypothetical protein DFQ27_008582 [Actinomortierella ambigua]|uniref:Gag1-like clamp domain-containing protein n=1 Tax=Actinomortierella ambigua TaxID=1343610 RepID=A0A9P6PQ56_9FUNG|nr:hypothetical protein DFQ27_008582 [Actinomortierella ambigua]